MLGGSAAGGFIAQATNLGVPFMFRAAMLGVTLAVAWWFMRDLGFTPQPGASPLKAVRGVLRGSIDGGFRNPPVRWLMLAAPFSAGVGFYAFYAMQPYLLQLYGDKTAYGVAGLAAAMVAGAQIDGIGNASTFSVPTTQIIITGSERRAQADSLRKTLGFGDVIERPGDAFSSDSVDITVILGADALGQPVTTGSVSGSTTGDTGG